jgi:hypothetical protein
MGNITISLLYALDVSIALAIDTYRLGRAVVRLPVAFGSTVYRWFIGTSSPQPHSLDQETIMLDFQCISWMLRLGR